MGYVGPVKSLGADDPRFRCRCGQSPASWILHTVQVFETTVRVICRHCGSRGEFSDSRQDEPEIFPQGEHVPVAVTLSPAWLLEYGAAWVQAYSGKRGRGHAPRTEVPRWNALARLLPSVKRTLRGDGGRLHTAKFTAQALWDAFAGHLLACGWRLEMGVPVCPAQLAGTRAHWRLAKTLRAPDAVAAALPAMQAKLAALETIHRHVLES